MSADHTYARKGSYGVAIQIHGFVDDEVAVAGGYAVVLALEDHARVQTILDSDLEWDGSISSTTTYGPGTYEVIASGNYTYTLTVSMTDGLYSTVDATYEGTLEFGIVEAGDSTPTGFDFDMYALIDSGYVDSDRTIAISDLEGSATRSEISSMYITLSKDIDLYAEFVHAASLSTSLVVEEDAVYGGAVYHNEETVTTINEVAEEGSYGTGDYTETQDGSPAFRAAKAAIGGGANLATPAAIPFSSPSRKQAISSPALTPLPAAYRTAGGTPGPPTTTTPAANGNPAAMALPLRSRKPPTGFRATMP